MTDQIKPYDPGVIMKNVADKIKASFAELIPDEKWQEMVQIQVDKFVKTSQNRWGNQQTSEFETMCETMLKEIAQEKIKEHIVKKYDEHLSGQHVAIDDALKLVLQENAEIMFANIMRNQFQQMILQLKNTGQL